MENPQPVENGNEEEKEGKGPSLAPFGEQPPAAIEKQVSITSIQATIAPPIGNEDKKEVIQPAQPAAEKFNSEEDKVKVKGDLDFEQGFRQKFKPYKEIINNLTKMQICETDNDLVFCTLSNDSKRILTVIMVEDEHYIINQYDSDSLKKTFSKELQGNYIKAKEISQNKEGSIFVCPYLNDGVFHLLVFDQEKELYDFEINQAIGIDNLTRPNDNFPDPMISVCFVEDDKKSDIFVNLYHTPTHTMWYFLYSYETHKLTSDPIQTPLRQTTRNFPLSCFYDDDRHFVYVFFRQGETYFVNLQEMRRIQQQRISDWDIGNAYLYNNKVLMIMSSNQLLFFKLELINDKLLKRANQMKWKKYHELDIQGFIHHMKGSDRFQVVTDSFIYFYEFDEEDESLIPQKQYVMSNFMECIQLMFNNEQDICVTYKSG